MVCVFRFIHLIDMLACRFLTRDWNIVSHSAPFSHNVLNILLCFVLILVYQIWLRFSNLLNNRFVLDAVASRSLSIYLRLLLFICLLSAHCSFGNSHNQKIIQTFNNEEHSMHHTEIQNKKDGMGHPICIF